MMLLELIERTWEELRKEKNEAKQVLKDIQVVVDHWERMWETAENIEKELSEIYYELPESQRQDYIQKTLDLLKYGFDIDVEWRPDGFIDIFHYIYTVCLSYQEQAEKLYKEKDYKSVTGKLEDLESEVERIKEIYGKRRKGF